MTVAVCEIHGAVRHDFITLTFTMELRNEHSHDVVKFSKVSGTSPADAVQK